MLWTGGWENQNCPTYDNERRKKTREMKKKDGEWNGNVVFHREGKKLGKSFVSTFYLVNLILLELSSV